jgi:hypothetical protein
MSEDFTHFDLFVIFLKTPANIHDMQNHKYLRLSVCSPTHLDLLCSPSQDIDMNQQRRILIHFDTAIFT